MRRSSRMSDMMSQVGARDSGERQYCSEGVVAAWEPSQNSVDLRKHQVSQRRLCTGPKYPDIAAISISNVWVCVKLVELDLKTKQ